MKHALPLGLLLWLGCADNAELPPIELGGPGGARLMNGQGRSPQENYEIAHSQLHRQHYNVLRNLEPRSQNPYAARAALDAIVQNLEIMKSLASPADRARFDPYIARYRGWSADVAANRWGGSFTQDVERSEYELKAKLSPDNVEIVADPAVAAPAPAATTSPAPRPAPAPANAPAAGVPDDKAVTPEKPPAPPAPAPAPAAVAAPAPAPAPAPANASSARLFYKAWDRSHDDLVALYKAKKDCRAAYEDVVGSLRQLHANTDPAKRGKLELYLDYYAGIHEKTKGFTTLPQGEKIAEKDIVDELDVAARVIRKEFNPEK